MPSNGVARSRNRNVSRGRDASEPRKVSFSSPSDLEHQAALTHLERGAQELPDSANCAGLS